MITLWGPDGMAKAAGGMAVAESRHACSGTCSGHTSMDWCIIDLVESHRMS